MEVTKLNEAHRKIGDRIWNFRIAQGLTREQFSEAADISSKFLYEVETGQKGLSADTLMKICKAFRISSDYLLFGEERTAPDKEFVSFIMQADKKQLKRVAGFLEALADLP